MTHDKTLKILVTGNKGFIGTNLVELLHIYYPDAIIYGLDKGTSISNDSLQNRYGDEDWYVEYIGDICNDIDIDKSNICHVDFVFHLAAESHVDRSIEGVEPFIKSNIQGTTNIAEWCAKFGIPMINVSTDEVYGEVGEDGHAFREDTPLNPRNPYAVSKTSADLMVDAIGRMYPDWGYVTTRCVNNFGDHQDSTKFIPVIIDAILSGNKIPLYGEGKQQRSWIHVDDHCMALVMLMESLLNGDNKHKLYNIGTTDCYTNINIIELICALMGVEPDDYIEFVDDPRGQCHDKIYKQNSDRIRDISDIGWMPEMEGIMAVGLKMLIDNKMDDAK